ncbi:MAG: glycosyltransferase [Clostridiaceae bacterium]|nr:glycosyltransferase [Clostridiaceae bacterium]
MRTPNKIVWIAAGNQENESLVSLFSNLVKQVPWNCTNLLITNAANWRTFNGETYKVTVDKEEDHSLVARYRQVVLAAYHENVLEDADIIVTGGMTAVMLAYMLTHGNSGITLRNKPIVYVSPKVPEKGVAEFTVEGYEESMFWWMVGNIPNVHAVVLDNDTEYELADKRLFRACPNTDKKIRRLILWKYEPLDGMPEKEDKVVWSGRWNNIKKPDIAAKIMAILSGRGIDVEFFIPTISASRRRLLTNIKETFQSVYIGLDSQEYRKEAGNAKVLLITSEVEGQPLGYLELLELGVVPVIRKRPWMKTFMGEDWPLVYTNEGEAVELCIEAMRNYDKYMVLMQDRLKARYNKDPNFSNLITGIWEDYVAGDYTHDYSLDVKGRGVF